MYVDHSGTVIVDGLSLSRTLALSAHPRANQTMRSSDAAAESRCTVHR